MGVRRGQGEERAAGGVGWAPRQAAALGAGLWGGPPRGQGPRLVPAPPPAGVVDALQQPELVCAARCGERGSGGGSDPWGLSVRRRARSARLGPRTPLPQPGRRAGPPGAGLGGRPRKIPGRPLRGGGEVTRGGGGRRGRGFPQLARRTALPRAAGLFCVPVAVLGVGPPFLQYCGIVVLSGGALVSME